MTRATRQRTETLVYCKSRRDAEQVLALRQGQVFDRTYRPRALERPPTVAEYAVEFLKTKEGQPIHADYERSFRLHLTPYFGRMLVCEVSTRDGTNYRAWRLGQGASAKTVKNELDYLGTLYSMAKAEGVATLDPTAGVDHGKMKSRRERLLTRDELRRLLVALSATKGWLRPFFVVLHYTGMRLSDVCALPWERIDFDMNYLAQKQKKTGEWVYPPMHAALVRELAAWRAECRSSKWVFPQAAAPSKHISRHAIVDPWARLLEQAGVQDFTRHDMRKLLVTTLKALGARDDQVKGITGHATTAMVAHYNLGPDKAKLDATREAVDMMSDLMTILDEPETGKGLPQVIDKKPNDNAK